jgi:hypothetical protein
MKCKKYTEFGKFNIIAGKKIKKNDIIICKIYLCPELDKGTIRKIYNVDKNMGIQFEKDGIYWDPCFFKLYKKNKG